MAYWPLAGGVAGISMPGIEPSLVSGVFIDAIFAQQGHPPDAVDDCPGTDCGAASLAAPHMMQLPAGVAWAAPVAAVCSIIPQPAAYEVLLVARDGTSTVFARYPK